MNTVSVISVLTLWIINDKVKTGLPFYSWWSFRFRALARNVGWSRNSMVFIGLIYLPEYSIIRMNNITKK